jgi:hypothetical protein
MNKNIKIFLAIILCGGALFGDKIVTGVGNLPSILTPAKPDIAPETITEPLEEFKNKVKNIIAIEIEKDDSKLISAFFAEMADVIKNDNEFVKSAGQFRKFNMVAGGLNFNKNIKDKYQTLGEEIDKLIMDSIGKEDAVMDENKRSVLVNCLNAIAWGVKQ